MKRKKGHKIFTIVLITGLLLLTYPAGAYDGIGVQALSMQTALPEAISIKIDGQNVQFSEQSGSPFIDENSRTQVPFRATMEKFGATVSWDNDKRTAIAEKDNITVEVPVGQHYIIKDGTKIQNDTAALIKDSRTYLPIRAVLEAFGADVSWDQQSQTVVVTSSGQIMTIHFIDVGQGDCILIDCGEYEILIDGGNRKDGKPVANYISKYVDGALELIIATHNDADHVGGLIDIINTYEVDRILYMEDGKDTATYKDFRNASNSKQNCNFEIALNETVKIDDNVSFIIIPPVKIYKDTNENSIVSQLIYNNVKVLCAGDMERESERDLMNRFSKVDVLKLSHHGSRYTSSTAFLDRVKPDVVIISAGLVNQYNHPHYDALERVFNTGAKAYGTFRDGTIIMSTNGQTYSLTAKTPLTLNDAGDKGSNSANQVVNNTQTSENQYEVAQYVGNKSTKKVHYTSCSSANQIAEQNRIFFYTLEGAVGYSPCGICLAQ